MKSSISGISRLGKKLDKMNQGAGIATQGFISVGSEALEQELLKDANKSLD
jgi:hypothetical protein